MLRVIGRSLRHTPCTGPRAVSRSPACAHPGTCSVGGAGWWSAVESWSAGVMQARGGGGRRAQELASTIRVVEHAKGHARARVAGRVVAAWLACHSEWGAGQRLGRTATQADAELSRPIGTAWCDGSVPKEFESRLPPTHCDPWKSEQVPSTVPSLAIDMHDVLLAHQPQPELAKHVPQDGRLSHPALAASTCANASRAVLKPMTGHTRAKRQRKGERSSTLIRTIGEPARP